MRLKKEVRPGSSAVQKRSGEGQNQGIDRRTMTWRRR